MKTLKFTLTSIAALSLMACQTVPEDTLFAGIPADKISAAPTTADSAAGFSTPVVSPASSLAESQIRASAYNPTCAQFNMNTLAFAARPETPSFGTTLFKTILLGTVAGAASGGVAAMGINSSFLETAAASTVNQVVYSGGRPVVNQVIPDVKYLGADKELAIAESAARLDCPNPAWASTLSPSEAAVLVSKLNGEAKAAQKMLKAANKIRNKA